MYKQGLDRKIQSTIDRSLEIFSLESCDRIFNAWAQNVNGLNFCAKRPCGVRKSGLQTRRFTDLPPQSPTQFLPTHFHALSTNFHEKRMHSNSAPPRTPTHFHELPPTFHELPPTFHELPPTLHKLPPTFHELPRTSTHFPRNSSMHFHELPQTSTHFPRASTHFPRTSTHFPRTSTNYHALSTKFLKESLQHWPCENGFVHFVKDTPRPLSKNHFLPEEPVLTGFARLEDLAFCSLGVPVSFLLLQPLDTQVRPTATPPPGQQPFRCLLANAEPAKI